MNIQSLRSYENYSVPCKVPLKSVESVVSGDSVSLSGSGREWNSADIRSLRGLVSSGVGAASEVSGGYKSGFVEDYMDAREIDVRVRKLTEQYPDLAKLVVSDIHTSGYDGKVESLRGPVGLSYVKLGSGVKKGEDKPGVLLMAAPHAREMVNPLIMLETMQQLLENYNPESCDPKVREITDLLDSVNIYMVCVSNPDGLNYAKHDEPMWRKTRSPIPGSDAVGVDINRNFDYLWLPSDPAKATYSGPGPASEPETRFIMKILEDHPDIKFACDFHSHGSEIRRPLDVTDENDLEIFKNLQSRVADAIQTHRGERYDKIESVVVNGASDDYMYFKRGIYALIMETAREFQPPREEALQVVSEVTNGALEIVRFARDYAESQREKSGIEALAFEISPVFAGMDEYIIAA